MKTHSKHFFKFDSRMAASNISKIFRRKLVISFEELDNPYKKAERIQEINQFYKNSTELYLSQMDKFLTRKGFLEDGNFEERHRQSYRTASEMFKSQRIPDSDKSIFREIKRKFHRDIDAYYTRYKQRNKVNREKSKKKEPLTKPAAKLILSQAQDLYNREMQKVGKYQLSELEFQAKDDEIQRKCLQLVSWF